MVPKGTTKFIKSLQLKKYRKAEQCFLVEGEKCVSELLQSDYEVVLLACTQSFLKRCQPNVEIPSALHVTTEKYLVQAGTLQTNDSALAVAKMKPVDAIPQIENEFAVMLDDIRDPGNMGTIIRTCDWYGIKKIIASETSTDAYAPKVVNATMGSLFRVAIYYVALESFLERNERTVYGAFLEGESANDVQFTKPGVILIGSESHGISPALEKWVTCKITIPKYGRAESLNAAVATGVILDCVMRK